MNTRKTIYTVIKVEGLIKAQVCIKRETALPLYMFIYKNPHQLNNLILQIKICPTLKLIYYKNVMY